MHTERETDRSKGLSAGQNYWTTLVKHFKLLDTLLHILFLNIIPCLIVIQQLDIFISLVLVPKEHPMDCLTLSTKPIGSFKTSGYFYPRAEFNIPEDLQFHQRCF